MKVILFFKLLFYRSALFGILISVWWAISYLKVFPEYAFPSPDNIWLSFVKLVNSFRFYNDILYSLYRILFGFLVTIFTAIPLGVLIGLYLRSSKSLITVFNFFRFISPLAWIPFAILWFQIGDKPAIFIIIMASFFPLIISVIAAVRNIPESFFRVAKEYQFGKRDLFLRLILPAINRELITSLRICFGISWVVIIAAEMVGSQDGLGYAIWDARNGLKLDIAVCYIITIGILGILLDNIFQYCLTKTRAGVYAK